MRSPRTHETLTPAAYEELRGGHLDRRRAELVADELEQRRAEIATVLELGFGAGKQLFELASRYPEVTFRGVDADSRMVEYALGRYSRANLSYALAGNGSPLPGPFDFVFSIDVLHHVEEL